RRLALRGIPVPGPGDGAMNLHLAEAQLKSGDASLETCIGSYRPYLLIGIGPGSKIPSRISPSEGRAMVGKCLVPAVGALPSEFGGREDKALGDRLVAKWGVGINAAGELNIRQAAVTLSHCQLYVGNDTGTMHLAAAVHTPCVAIFSARDFPGR